MDIQEFYKDKDSSIKTLMMSDIKHIEIDRDNLNENEELVNLASEYIENNCLKKKKEKAANEEKREPRIRIEGIDVKNADMGDVVKDFQSSDAPQFKGKSKEKKREMAIAAKLNA